jgi:hypothetical protein
MDEHSEDLVGGRRAAGIGGLRTLDPPAHLREPVLRAMADAAAGPDRVSSKSPFMRPLAIAAGIAVVAVIAGLTAMAPSIPDGFEGGRFSAAESRSDGSAADAPAASDALRFDLRSDADPADLMRFSWNLEAALAQLPAQRRLMSADTASTIAALETRIAVIDEQLTLGTAAGIAPEIHQALWWNRVSALNALVQVRYAQSEVFAY